MAEGGLTAPASGNRRETLKKLGDPTEFTCRVPKQPSAQGPSRPKVTVHQYGILFTQAEYCEWSPCHPSFSLKLSLTANSSASRIHLGSASSFSPPWVWLGGCWLVCRIFLVPPDHRVVSRSPSFYSSFFFLFSLSSLRDLSLVHSHSSILVRPFTGGCVSIPPLRCILRSLLTGS